KESDFSFDGNAVVKGTDAGTYDMNLTAENFKNTSKNFTNVKFVVEDGKLVVTPRDVTLTSEDVSRMYNGKPLKNGDKDIKVSGDGFVNNEGVNITFTGSITDVGNVDNTFAYAAKDGTEAKNYNITPKYGKLTVTPLTEVVVTVRSNGDTVQYDGTKQSVTGYKVVDINNSLYSDKDFTFKGNATASGVDVGTYDTNIRESDFVNNNNNFANVRFNVENSELKIIKREVVLTSASGSKVYDGKELTKNNPETDIVVSGDGIVEGDKIGFVIIGSQTDIGSSDNTFRYAFEEENDEGNYDVTTVFGTLTVTAAPAVPVVTPTTPPTPVDGPVVGVITGTADGGYEITTIEDNKTPLANNLLSEHCCILQLLLMLAALITYMLYTKDMKRRQRRIFELEEELTEYRG
ncbi:MAG: hypothetical protein GX663_00685, partial [Clostridiales bacterium]|nr:hypothetical protein [Clostridiales bacterium]